MAKQTPCQRCGSLHWRWNLTQAEFKLDEFIRKLQLCDDCTQAFVDVVRKMMAERFVVDCAEEDKP